MKKRLISVLAFALAVSAGAAFVLYQLIASKVRVGAAAAPAPTTTKVFVAARDMELGALIAEKDIRLQEFLTPPAGSITKKEDIVGRGVAQAMHADTPFFEGGLTAKGAGAGLAATIPPGMRAFAIHVNEVVGVAGFAVAGMKVDILVSGSMSGGGNGEGTGPITRTLLQNIQVLSAGQNYQKDAEGKPVMVQVVNLLVTPEQAEQLNLASENRIQMVLRNPTDTAVVKTPGASTAGLFAGAPIRVPKFSDGSSTRNSSTTNNGDAARYEGPRYQRPAAPEYPPVDPNAVTIEVIAGDKKSQTTFITMPAAPQTQPGKTVPTAKEQQP